MDTNGGRWGELGIYLNSRTHEQINQPVSRQDAKAQRGKQYSIFKVFGGAGSVLPEIGDPNSQNRHGWTRMGERGEGGS